MFDHATDTRTPAGASPAQPAPVAASDEQPIPALADLLATYVSRLVQTVVAHPELAAVVVLGLVVHKRSPRFRAVVSQLIQPATAGAAAPVRRVR